MLLYTTFKQIIQIVCLATGDCKLASLSYDALIFCLHKMLLQKLAQNKENTQPNGFWSLNLELDSYAKSNK
jgi:hypothetical protein